MAGRPHDPSIVVRGVAEPSLRGVEGHVRDAAHVDAGRGQDPYGRDALGQPFLARDALRDGARPHDVADSARRADLPDRLRLHRPPARRSRRATAPCAPLPLAAALGRRLLPRGDGRAARARASRCRSRRRRTRWRTRSPSSEDRAHASYDAGAAPPASGGSLVQADRVFKRVPRPLHRQVQPGALLLGQLRPRGHALLGAPGAAPSRRRAELARLGHARGLLARGQQLRLLAGRRADAAAGVLRLRLSRAGGLQRRAASDPRAPRYDPTLHEFVLPYDVVRTAASPDAALLEFLQSTYEAAADLGRWDRPALEWNGPSRDG